jgi:hypothetical protein
MNTQEAVTGDRITTSDNYEISTINKLLQTFHIHHLRLRTRWNRKFKFILAQGVHASVLCFIMKWNGRDFVKVWFSIQKAVSRGHNILRLRAIPSRNRPHSTTQAEVTSGQISTSFVIMRWDYFFCETAAANGPTVHPPDDTRVNMDWRWNYTDRGNRTTRRKTCPSATLSTSNPTSTALGTKPGLRDEKPATNRLSYGTANLTSIRQFLIANINPLNPSGNNMYHLF